MIVHPRHEGLPKALALAEISSFTKEDEGVEILSIQERIGFGFRRADTRSAAETIVRAEAAGFPVAPRTPVLHASPHIGLRSTRTNRMQVIPG